MALAVGKKNERKKRIRAPLIVEFNDLVYFRQDYICGPQRTRKDIAIWLAKRKRFSCGLPDLQCAVSLFSSLNFPVKFSYELHISEAWKLIFLLRKRSGNRSLVEMQTARRTEIETC